MDKFTRDKYYNKLKVDNFMVQYWNILQASVEDLDHLLSKRTLTKIKTRTNIKLIGDLLYAGTDLLRCKHFGRVALIDVRNCFEAMGLWEYQGGSIGWK